jgi:hypothetical protein
MMLLQPKDVDIVTQTGETKTFVLSKFPAIAGREIISKYPTSNIPKLGDYSTSEEVMLKLMAYVGVPRDDGEPLKLSTRALVDNHMPDWETLVKVEFAMMEYNCSFFGNGKGSTFLEAITQKAQAFLSQTLMDLSARSSEKARRP